MTDFNVGGNNNRVAGRDYHEHQYLILPCPYCEQRYLSPGRTCCRHCEEQFEELKRRREREAIHRKRQGKVIRFIAFMSFVVVCSLLISHFGPVSWRGAAQVIGALFVVLIFITSKIFF
ncbi:hypothetical protein HLB27_06565 [Dickeya dadantii]|uniref:hypothetical protein n=1 Tax=Dickeya dadantii TaxID=204038 RepID=UPI0014955D98|nr:hypothetical protein [Dickeya dadantii]NPE59266.1 hypothetical protein [Dickeya dadantii]NPE70345.1 hypothetical protein [Dickeya dadantii]